MPGSGKSTISKKLAEYLGLELFDSDEEIEKKTGKTPKQIIEDCGEEKFRKIETEVLKELSLKRNIVLSTGGGVVTKKENEFLLKTLGSVVLIKRKLKLLDKTGRPLSSDKNKLKALYKNRKKAYKQFSDYTIKNNKDINKTLKRILKNEDFSS